MWKAALPYSVHTVVVVVAVVARLALPATSRTSHPTLVRAWSGVKNSPYGTPFLAVAASVAAREQHQQPEPHALCSSPSKHSTMAVYGRVAASEWGVVCTAPTSLDARRCRMADAVGVGRGRLLLDGGCMPCAAGGPQIGIGGAEDMEDQAGDITPVAPRWLGMLLPLLPV